MPAPRAFLSLALAAAALLAFSAPAVAAPTPLSLNGFSDLVVDEAKARVYVSGGSGSSSVVVLDFNGNVVTTIGSQPGAAGLGLPLESSAPYLPLRDPHGNPQNDNKTQAG